MIAKKRNRQLSQSTEEQLMTLVHQRVQVAILSARIAELTEHLKENQRIIIQDVVC